LRTLALEADRFQARSLRVSEAARPEPAVESARPIAGLAAAAVAMIGAGLYIGYVVRYSTNGVFQDEWNWVGLVGKSYAGTLTLGDLWKQHNENRMLFPNAIAVLLGSGSGFNDLTFIYLSAALLVVTACLLAFACRRELSRHPFAYLPAIFVIFSVAQYENSLWAFQLAWFTAVACIAGAIALLTAHRLNTWRLVGAVALGVVASYSVIAGLTIWAAGLVALLRPGVTRKQQAAWCVAGVAVTGLYVVDYRRETFGGLPSHLPQAVQGLFVTVGSVVPALASAPRAGADLTVPTVLGAIITVAASLVLVSWVLQRPRDRVLTIAAALVMVGLLFDLMLMPSRLSREVLNATLSRYTTFNLLLLAGVYIGAIRTLIIALESAPRRQIAIKWAFAGASIALVCLQIPAATRAGVLGGTRTYAMHSEAANLTANHAIAPRSLVAAYAYATSYDYFQIQAAFLEANHLNVFGDGESAYYRQVGILNGGVVRSPLPVPPEFGSVRSDPAQWRAWLALSSVYEQRPDLQAAFPGPNVLASRQMVAWAMKYGMDPADPIDSAVLLPYSSHYQAWLAEEAH
jgi:hypothetical protein